MSKDLNKPMKVTLDFSANTEKAKLLIKDLLATLSNLVSSTRGRSDFGIRTELQQAVQDANKLEHALNSAMNVDTGKLDLKKFSDLINPLQLLKYALSLAQLGPSGLRAFKQVTNAILLAEIPLKRTSKLLTEFKNTFSNTLRWQFSSSLLHGFMSAVSSAYRYAQDLNESLNNIRIVTGQNTDLMAAFAARANEAANALSTTTNEYAKASLIYYQLGLNDEDVQARTDVTIKLANVSKQSAQEVSNQMTAIWNNFAEGSENLEYYADVITALGASTASSSEEIATGLEKFAAVSKTVGLSYEYATAALATITATTRQSADTVGTGLRTLFSRLESLKLGETLEDGVDLNKYSKALQTVGVDILDATGNLKDMDTILDETAARWLNLDLAQKMAFASTVGGVRQYTNLIALMDNWDFMQENLSTARNSEGTVQKLADIYAESWEAARNRVLSTLEEVYNKLLNSEGFIQLLNAGESAIKTISEIIDGLGGVKGVLLVLSNILIRTYSKEIAGGINNFLENMSLKSRRLTQDLEEYRRAAVETLKTMSHGKSASNAENAAYTSTSGTSKVQMAYLERITQIKAKHLEVNEMQDTLIKKEMDYISTLGDELTTLGEIADAREADVSTDVSEFTAMGNINLGDSLATEESKIPDLKKELSLVEEITQAQERKKEAEEALALAKADTSKYSAEDVKQLEETVSLCLQEIDKKSGGNAELLKGIGYTRAKVNAQKEVVANLKKEDDQFSENAGLLKSLTEQYKQLKTETNLLTEASKQLSIARDSGSKEARDNALQYLEALKELNPAIAKLLEGSTSLEDAQNKINNKLKEYNATSKESKDSNQGLIEQIIKLCQQLHWEEEDYRQLIGDLNSYADSSAKAAGLTVKFKMATELAANNASKLEAKTVTAGEAFTNLVSAGMSMAMTFNMASSLGENLYDVMHGNAKGASVLTSIFSTLSSAIQTANTVQKLFTSFTNMSTAATNANTAAVEANTVAVNSNPWLLLATVVLTAIIAGISAHNKKIEEQTKLINDLAEVTKDNLKAKKEEIEENNKLVASYKDLLAQYLKNGEGKDALISSADELIDKYDIEDGRILLLTEDYDKLTEAINNKIKASNEEEHLERVKAIEAAEKLIKNDAKDVSEIKWKEGDKKYSVNFGYHNIQDASDIYQEGAGNVWGRSNIAALNELSQISEELYNYILKALSGELSITQAELPAFTEAVKKYKELYALQIQNYYDGLNNLLESWGATFTIDLYANSMTEQERNVASAELDEIITKIQDAREELFLDESYGIDAQKTEELNQKAKEYDELIERIQEVLWSDLIGVEDLMANSANMSYVDNFLDSDMIKHLEELNELYDEEHLSAINSAIAQVNINDVKNMDEYDALVDDILKKWKEFDNYDVLLSDEDAKKMINNSLMIDKRFQGIAASADLIRSKTSLMINESEEDLKAFYNGLSKEDLELFIHLNFVGATEDDLTKQLEIIKKSQKINDSIKLDNNVTKAKSSLKESMSSSDYEEFFADNSELFATRQELLDFIKLSYTELLEYLNELLQSARAVLNLKDELQNLVNEYTPKIEENKNTLAHYAELIGENSSDYNINELLKALEKIQDPAEITEEFLQEYIENPDVANIDSMIDYALKYVTAQKDKVLNEIQQAIALSSLDAITSHEANTEIDVMLETKLATEDYEKMIDDLSNRTISIGAEFSYEDIEHLAELGIDYSQYFQAGADGMYTLVDGAKELEGILDARKYENYAQGLILLQGTYNDLILMGRTEAIDPEAFKLILSEIEKTSEKMREMQETINFSHWKDDINAAGLNFEEVDSHFDRLLPQIEEYNESLKENNEFGKSVVEGNDKITKGLGNERQAARDTAIANQRLNRGISTLADNYDNWINVLKNGDKTSAEYSKVMEDMKDTVADLLDVADGEMFSDKFIQSIDPETLLKIADGDIEALNSIRRAATDDIVLNILINLEGDEEAYNQAQNLWMQCQTLLDEYGPLEVGTHIDGTDEFVTRLNELIAAAGMTREQVTSMLGSMGMSATVHTEYEKQDMMIPTYDEHFESMTTDPGDEESGRPASYVRRKYTVPGEPYKVEGYQEVVSIETSSDGKSSGGGIDIIGASAVPNAPRGGVNLSNTGGYSNKKKDSGSSKDNKKETKDKKDPTDEKERYHIINSQIEQQTTQLDRLSRAKDRAFGAQRQKEYQKEIQNLKNLGDMYEEHLRQSTDYLATDKAALMQWGAIISDKDGSVLNYDALVQAQVDAYNEAVERYNNSAQTDADKEALKAAEDAYKQFQDDLKQYEETLGQYNEDIDNYVDNMIQQYDTMKEKTADAIEFKLQYDDDVLDFIDRLIDRLDDWNDSLFNAIDKIGKLNDKMGALFDKETTLLTGVNETLQHFLMDYKEYDEFGNVSYSTGLSGPLALAFIDRFNSGNLDSTDLEMLSHMPEDEYNALRDYIQLQQDLEDQMRETANQVVESVQDQWDKAKDELAEAAKPIASAAEALDNYTQIIDIVGADYLGITSELAEYLDQATIDVAHEATAAAKATMESLAAQRDEIQKLYDNAIADGDGEMAEKYRKQLQGINDDVQSATEEFHLKWQEELRSIREAFEETVDRVKDDMLDAFAGPNNTWREFKDSFDYAKEAADRFVPEYKEIYELSKLNRDINKSIDDTDNVKNKEALRNLQKEINKLEEKSGELSQYDLDNARRKYELELARLALEEASTIKDTVRLSKDSEGNWSYIYTADQEDVAAAEQNYEDKLYAMQEANANYIDELQDQMVQAEEAYADKVTEIMKDNTISEELRLALLLAARQQFDETMDYYSGLLQTTMDNNKDLYDDDWTWYANYTANKAEMEALSGENFKQNLGYRLGDLENYVTNFNNTALGALTGFNTLDGYNQNIATSTDNGEKSMSAAWERWDLNTKRAMKGAGTSVEGFAGDMKDDIDNTIVPKAKEAAKAVEQMGLDMAEYMKGVVNAADEWRKQWNDKLQDIINKNDAATKSMEALSKMASQLNTDVIGASTAIQEEMEKAVNSVGAAAGQMASALAAAKAAQADLNNTNNWGSGDGDANKKIPSNGSGGGSSSGLHGCFVPGTKILMANGLEKNIEDIILGEKVIAYNEALNKFEFKTVIQIHARVGYNKIAKIELSNGKTLELTLGHPIYTLDGWQSLDIENSLDEHDTVATYLTTDSIVCGFNELYSIKSISIYEVPNDFVVYCLGTEDVHTFIANGVIAHNAKVSAFASAMRMATGGYTGAFDNPTEGKLAVLHLKELVLNESDTANILSAVDMVRSLSLTIDAFAHDSQFALGNLSAGYTISQKGDTLLQEVHITAEFPNAQDRNEIEAAFETLINQASQYANRKNI